MSSFTYRKLSPATASDVLDYCDNNGISYDYNTEEMITVGVVDVEIGVENWDLIPKELIK